MGGTSTDVALCAGEPEQVTDTEIGGVRIRAPVVRIHTIAAGGGSVLRFEQGRLQVGPQSAGANPGPACYRRGGPLAVTDANLLLGRILPEFFPAVFGPDGDAPLDAAVVASAFSRLAATINRETGTRMAPEAVAAGFLQIAVDNMANAIRRISLGRGFDPREFTLCCFGGAGGQHACPVADRLGITRILIHPFAGVLSAWGIGGAPLRAYRQRSTEKPLGTPALDELRQELTALATACREELVGQGATPGSITIRTTLYLRATGSDAALPLAPAPVAALRAAFGAAHRRRFGFEPVTADLIIASVRVEATTKPAASPEPVAARRSPPPPVAERGSRLYSGEAWLDADVYRRTALRPGQSLAGPAIITEENATTVVDAGWLAQVDALNNLILRRTAPETATGAAGTAADPVLLEVFNNQFMAIAEEMGTILQNTAHSVNIKERLDFSCALFDGEGNLIANAPHMPVHLGSMGASVRAVLAANAGQLRSGDAFMLNSPFQGGTHLPDVTVVTPVAPAADGTPAFFVACRGHHADIGGVTPGSMPPDSHTIEEEGVVIENFRLVETGRFRTEAVRELLTRGSYPARNPEQNIADLRAQVAANATGVHALGRLLERYGEAVVRSYMGHVRRNAEECVRRVIERLRDGEYCCTLDGGETIRVHVAVDRARREATVDFTGTSPRSGGNFNAPAAITRAAVLYVFRTLVGSDIPLNDGCLTPLRIVLPPDSLLDPWPPAAVAAGNVETSQCLTDALYGALGAMAACQGTMNNLTFGNGRFQYYETICGGAGAGPDFDGASCVHTHMTNSRMTDPEVLESRYPVLVREFALRAGSGGTGRHRGGDGARRALEFRAPMQVAILAGRRTVAPFGLAGGGPGKPGRSCILRPGGAVEELGATARLSVSPGDVLVIETPGGGGYGRPD
jgi:5-oxoprolinase (ATP-hydrolysing)